MTDRAIGGTMTGVPPGLAVPAPPLTPLKRRARAVEVRRAGRCCEFYLMPCTAHGVQRLVGVVLGAARALSAC